MVITGFMETEKNVFPVSLIESRILSILQKLSRYFSELRIESYVVGGLLRDSIIGKETSDIDIAVSADPLEITSDVASLLDGKPVLMDKLNRVGRIVLKNEESPIGIQYIIDITSVEGDIKENLSRRDFTLNAMAVDLSQFDRNPPSIYLLDPYGGFNDLDKCVIRVISDTAFKSDPVRLLRAVRLAAELDFKIDEYTETMIREYSSLISGVVGEKVRDELIKILAVPGSGKLLAYLDELCLLTAIFPEIEQAKGVIQPKEHFWDVFEHSLQTVVAVDLLIREGNLEYTSDKVLTAVPWSDELAQYFNREVSGGSTRKSLLKLAAVLHDIAKPQTKTFNSGGRMRFLGHAKDGADMVTDILERLRFSTKEVKHVEMLVKYHLRPTQMSQDEMPTTKAIYRYFRDTGETGIDVLFLSLADHLATRGPRLSLQNWEEHTKLVDYILSQRSEQENAVRSPKLVDGHDLINIFNMKQGREIGKILEAVREAQAAGELTTRKEALSFVEKMIPFHRKMNNNEKNSKE